MKKILLFLLFIFFTISIQAQQAASDSASVLSGQRQIRSESSGIKLTIFPVPVRNNYFTIKADRDIAFIKITNIIGQEIFRTRYNNPQSSIRIELDSPERGMYLVTIMFSDGLRIVKKIMIEETK
jgi:hypothetical protein